MGNHGIHPQSVNRAPVQSLLACRHLTSDILEGIVGYVKENKTGKMPTSKRKMGTGRDENDRNNLLAV